MDRRRRSPPAGQTPSSADLTPLGSQQQRSLAQLNEDLRQRLQQERGDQGTERLPEVRVDESQIDPSYVENHPTPDPAETSGGGAGLHLEVQRLWRMRHGKSL